MAATRVNAHAVSARVGGAVVVMAPDMRFLQLDEIGGEIWEMLTAGSDIDEIAHDLHRRYEIDLGTATSDTTRFVEQLAAIGLAEFDDN